MVDKRQKAKHVDRNVKHTSCCSGITRALKILIISCLCESLIFGKPAFVSEATPVGPLLLPCHVSPVCPPRARGCFYKFPVFIFFFFLNTFHTPVSPWGSASHLSSFASCLPAFCCMTIIIHCSGARFSKKFTPCLAPSFPRR